MNFTEKRYNKCHISTNYNYKNHIKISVLCKYRGTENSLIDIIKNIFELSSHPFNIELLIRIDKDQNDLYDFLSQNKIVNSYNIKIYSGERYGYRNLYQYDKDLISMSTGSIIFFFGDGVKIMDKGWEQSLYPYINKVAIIRSDSYKQQSDQSIVPYPYSLPIPIMTRKVYDILERWSPTTYSDIYLNFVAGKSGIRVHTEMKILFFDNTPTDGNEQHLEDVNFCKKHIESEEIKQEINSDVLKIINYCDKNNIKRNVLPDVVLFMGLYNLDPLLPVIELIGGEQKKYLVEFINKKNNILLYSTEIEPFYWCSYTPIKPYSIDLFIRVSSEQDGVFYEKELKIEG